MPQLLPVDVAIRTAERLHLRLMHGEEMFQCPIMYSEMAGDEKKQSALIKTAKGAEIKGRARPVKCWASNAVL